MTIRKLYREASKQHIRFYPYPLKKRKALAVRWGEGYAVAIDKSCLASEREEKQIVSEEISHCEYGLLYYLEDYANPLRQQNVRRAEALARRFGCRKLVPLAPLKRALGARESLEDLADRFDVEPWVVQTAIDSYRLESLL